MTIDQPKNYQRLHGSIFSLIGIVFLYLALKTFLETGLTSNLLGNTLVGIGAGLRGAATLLDPKYKESRLAGLGILISVAGIGFLNWQYLRH